jgi:hypothetical protein
MHDLFETPQDRETSGSTLAVPSGWCMTGHCVPHEHCGGCPGTFPEQTWPDPARKGGVFTTPERRCPHECHTRNL